MSLDGQPRIGMNIRGLSGTVVPNISLHQTVTTERFGRVVVQRLRVVAAGETGR